MILLINSLVIKPIHNSFVHHDYSESQHSHNNKSIHGENFSHKECDVCNFLLALYIPQQISEFKAVCNSRYLLIDDFYKEIRHNKTFSATSPRGPPNYFA